MIYWKRNSLASLPQLTSKPQKYLSWNRGFFSWNFYLFLHYDVSKFSFRVGMNYLFIYWWSYSKHNLIIINGFLYLKWKYRSFCLHNTKLEVKENKIYFLADSSRQNWLRFYKNRFFFEQITSLWCYHCVHFIMLFLCASI